MAKDRINQSDRKIINTQSGLAGSPDYRLPEVEIVGYEFRAAQSEPAEPVPDQENPYPGEEIDVPYDIQIDDMDVRIQPDGSAVVDLVASYIAVDGAKSHEVRISRL